MARVQVYTTPVCPYCVRAKKLLQSRDVAYEEIDVSEDDELRADVIKRTGRRTVPQIFIGAHHVGGSDDLHSLNAAGNLGRLLSGH